MVAVGALPYPVTFLCTDLISELWGEERATQVVWVGLLLNGWVVLILWVGGLMPGLNGAPDSTFFEIQRLAFGSVGASLVAYLTALVSTSWLTKVEPLLRSQRALPFVRSFQKWNKRTSTNWAVR